MSWTEGRIRSFITSVLRTGSRKWPPKYSTLNNSCVGVKLNEKSGRLAKHYRCNRCKGEFVAKEVEVDHVKPVIDPRKGFTTWDDYIKRLFCEETNLQTLCKECHALKTAKEKEIAKKAKGKK